MAAPTFKYATKTQLLSALRERYRSASKEEVWRLAYKIQGWYVDGYVTDANLTTMFGVSGAQLTALKQRIAAAADKWIDLQSAGGE